MFAYTIEAAQRATRLDRLVISSDDPELAEMAGRYDVEFIARPPDLAIDSAPLDDAVRHVRELLSERDGYHADLVITMQGNVPIRKEGQIDQVVEKLERTPQATAVCTAQELRFRPEWAKVMRNKTTGECAPYMPANGGFRTQDYEPIYTMDGAIYGVRWTTLAATAGNRAVHAWFGERLHLLVQDDSMYSLEVDYPDQATQAEYWLSSLVDRT